jgi:hypothetical protein
MANLNCKQAVGVLVRPAACPIFVCSSWASTPSSDDSASFRATFARSVIWLPTRRRLEARSSLGCLLEVVVISRTSRKERVPSDCANELRALGLLPDKEGARVELFPMSLATSTSVMVQVLFLVSFECDSLMCVAPLRLSLLGLAKAVVEVGVNDGDTIREMGIAGSFKAMLDGTQRVR